MKLCNSASLAAACLTLAFPRYAVAGASGSPTSRPSVAIVYEVEGSPTTTRRGEGSEQPLEFAALLGQGDRINLPASNQVEIAFVTGKRFAVIGPGQVTVRKDGLSPHQATLTELPAVPPLPHLPPISAAEQASRRTAAVVVRGDVIGGLVPADGETVLADQVVLRFIPDRQASRYQAEVWEANGNRVFETKAWQPSITIPRSCLQPGKTYSWSVRTVDRIGAVATGEASFSTLDSATTAVFRTLRSALEASSELEKTALLLAVEQVLGLAGIESLEPGLTIEKVVLGGAGEQAGLAAGDILRTWSLQAANQNIATAGGQLLTAFDLADLEVEQAPRGVVLISGNRGSQEYCWELSEGEWGVEVRPPLPDAARWPSGEALDQVVSMLEGRGRWREAVLTLHREIRLLLLQNEWQKARALLSQALSLGKKDEADDLLDATTMFGLGEAAEQSGDLTEARRWYELSLDVRRRLAPASTAVAESLRVLGGLAERQSALDLAKNYLREAIAIVEHRPLARLTLGEVLVNLGNVLDASSEPQEAMIAFRRALAIFRETAPGSRFEAKGLFGIALLEMSAGALESAEAHFRQALEICSSVGVGPLVASKIWTNLGGIARKRRDLPAAELAYRRALSLRRSVAPESPEVAVQLRSLGMVASDLGDVPRARQYFEEALSIRRRVTPEHPAIGNLLVDLGSLEFESGGDASQAEQRIREGLAFLETNVPGSLFLSDAHKSLGRVLAARGNFAAAQEQFSRANVILERLAPLATERATALSLLGAAEIASGAREAGADHLCLATSILDQQRLILGGTIEARASFESSGEGIYHECAVARWSQGRVAEAFGVVERGRARALLALLGERELRYSDPPPELESKRRNLRSAYDHTLAALGRLRVGHDDTEIEKLQHVLLDLRTQQNQLLDSLRRTYPRVGTLRDPSPLDATAVQGQLDPGTVLVAFSVGTAETLVFMISRGRGIESHLTSTRLPIGRSSLTSEVEALRRLLAPQPVHQAGTAQRAEQIGESLFGGFSSSLRRASRIVIIPDGPLHQLPFGMLRVRGRVLVHGPPIHLAPSASAYLELLQRDQAPELHHAAGAVAFGDPVYPGSQSETHSPELRSLLRQGEELARLPGSREELAGLALALPQARIYLAEEATEEQARRELPAARLIHFAVHGLLDERMPLNSALVLTIPEQPREGQENGLLQAWEIFESVRLDADLVTLSACETALGKDMGGEGLLGLTRAFQFAGARSVVASLWRVADDSTAVLMKHFYTQLAAGKTKDEALRAAQRQMIHSGDPKLAHPYAWAGFQLYGDWQ